MEFDLPVGPLADMSELLYVSALHQTSEFLREDGSISADDISRFLMSRYGVKASTDVVRDVILGGIISESGLGRENTDNGAMDLMEMVAVLFIPLFLKQAAPDNQTEGLVKACPNVVMSIAEMILHDVTGSREPKELSIDLIRNMFLKYGETAIAEDDAFLALMLKGAGGGGGGQEAVKFDKESFLKALTCDIQKYDCRNETKMSTNWRDVFGSNAPKIDHSVGDVICPVTGMVLTKGNINEENEDGVGPSKNVRTQAYENFTTVPTAQAIDFMADTYFCRIQVTLIWCFWVFLFFGYINGLIPTVQDQAYRECPSFSYLASWSDNGAPFGCSIGASIVDWLIFFFVAVAFGTFAVGIGSFGNDIEPKQWPVQVCSTVIIAALTLFFPIYFGIGDSRNQVYLRIVALVLGVLTALVRWLVIFSRRYPRFFGGNLMPGSSLKSEIKSKRASAFKLARMQTNAGKLYSDLKEDDVVKTYFGMILNNFAKLKPEYQPVGGLVYTWRGLRAGNLLGEEGIFYPSHIVFANVSQFLVCMFVLWLGIDSTIKARDGWIPPDKLEDEVTSQIEMLITTVADKALVEKAVGGIILRVVSYVAQLIYLLDSAGALQLDCLALGTYLDGFCQRFDKEEGIVVCNIFTGAPEALCATLEPLFRPESSVLRSASGASPSSNELIGVFNTTDLAGSAAKLVSAALSDNVARQANKLYPRERYMVTLPIALGCIVAFVACIATALVYVPSFTSTVLKVRSGVIPIFKSEQYQDIRQYYVNKGTRLPGVMFWGIVFSSLLIGGIFSAIIFFFVWQVTSFQAQKLIALAISLTLILTFQWLVTRTCRIRLYEGYYRKNPMVANLIELINEAFNFASSIAFVLVRILKLILLAALYVGRVDAPFLAPGVGVLSLGLIDPHSDFFLADIFAKEAHRHPYIESLGVIYLHKLKYGPTFLTSVGSAWRLLFVTALMPWLQKYRSGTRGQEYGGRKEKEAEEEEEEDPSPWPDQRAAEVRSVKISIGTV